ncbi:dihydrofolate reductase [Flavobacterium sp. TP390]|uniref:Dihydrofolate reductase n=1 Tax=Flavobacterium profundi TaxID=1774945 RepID=A0A6I4IDS8_9FLAO|nr:dihydrofolate reductase family protein [Flavobacterium profundi]MVO07560.1 dihydrofolate reductase [Flavobacterium profundi]
MRKIIGALNMTIDGICNHTAGIPDEAIHEHYTELLHQGDAILYGRKTYELMTYWQTILENPSEEKSMNEFALAIDTIPKIVFSNTLKEINWKSASLAQNNLKEEVVALKNQSGKAIFVGSRSLIIALLQLNLIDEIQLCIHPMVEGKGLSLFEDIRERMVFNLVKHKTFTNEAIILYYQPKKQ